MQRALVAVLGGNAIHGLLSGGVGVDGGHQTLLDSDALLVNRFEPGGKRQKQIKTTEIMPLVIGAYLGN